MYKSETFYTYGGLVKYLNEGIRPDQIVSITNASKESEGWVLIYKDDEEDYEKEPILSKVRAEIESVNSYGTNDSNDVWLKTPGEIKKRY